MSFGCIIVTNYKKHYKSTTRERENTLLELQPINWAKVNPHIGHTHAELDESI